MENAQKPAGCFVRDSLVRTGSVGDRLTTHTGWCPSIWMARAGLFFVLFLQGIPVLDTPQGLQSLNQDLVWQQITGNIGPKSALAAAPVAHAGSNRTFEKNLLTSATVTMQGDASQDPDGDPVFHHWYGPFGTSTKANPTIDLPEGRYTVSLLADAGGERSQSDRVEIDVIPCFSIDVRAKPTEAFVMWTIRPNVSHYDIYRSEQSAPTHFTKIGETLSTYSTFWDKGLRNDNAYLYMVGAQSSEGWCYSNVVTTSPPAVRPSRRRGGPAVTSLNHAPLIYSTAIELGYSGIEYNYDVNAVDSDLGDVLAYSLLQSPPGMTIDTGSGRIRWIPAAPGSYHAAVQVVDSKGKNHIQNFSISVSEVMTLNRPPAISSTPILEANEGQVYKYDLSATDPNANDELRFSLHTSPGGMSIDSVSGLIEWTPGNSHIGTHTVLAKVQDGGGLFDTQHFTINVIRTNHAPVIVSTPVIDLLNDQLFSYDVEATDPDANDQLTYLLENGPVGMSIDSSTGLIQWLPSAVHLGNHPVSVRVQDSGGLFDSQSFTLSVAHANQAPAITTTPVTSALDNQLYSYDVEAIDPDAGDQLTYSLENAPASMSIDSATGLVQWDPTPTQLGQHAVTIRVRDASGLFDEQSFQLTVTHPNQPPAITSTPSLEATDIERYQYDVEATDPDTGDLLAYSLETAPAGMSIEATTGLIQWEPTAIQLGQHAVTVRVGDLAGLFDEQNFQVVVSHPNQPPKITSTPVTSGNEGQQYSYSIAAEDEDQTFSIALLTAPQGMSIEISTGSIESLGVIFPAPWGVMKEGCGLIPRFRGTRKSSVKREGLPRGCLL